MQALMPMAQQCEPRDQLASFYARPTKISNHRRGQVEVQVPLESQGEGRVMGQS